MRLLILVPSLDAEPYRTLERAQRETWAADLPGPTIWYQGSRSFVDVWTCRGAKVAGKVYAPLGEWGLSSLGRHGTTHRAASLDGDVLHLGTPDVWSLTAAKLHGALQWALEEEDFDMLWRTNSSTYTHVPGLLAHIAASPAKGLYAGYIGEAHGVRFASGTGMLVSRDVAEAVVASGDLLRSTTVDDVAFAAACSSFGVDVAPLHKIDITSPDDVTAVDPTALFFVRCKSEAADRRMEAETLRRLHQLYAPTR